MSRKCLLPLLDALSGRRLRSTSAWTGVGLCFFGLAHADSSLTILHTNDFHSRFEPISAYDSPCDPEDNAAGDCFGGYARLTTAITDARARSPQALLVDGGDQFQGSLFYTYYKGKAAAEMMNALRYDAMTVGNHEFDDGPRVLREFIDAVNFPVLMSNADVSGEATLSAAIRPSVVIERAGERHGLIGLTPENTSELASPGPNVRFSDPVAAVQREVDRLEADGIDRIIVLSHSGYGVDQRIAEQTRGVDVIVGGHSNTLLSNTSEDAAGPYPTMVGDTAIVQAYAYGKFLGELTVEFDDEGVVASATGEPLLIDGQVLENPGIVERVQTLAEPLDAIRNEVVGSSADPIIGDREVCRVAECAMGNLVADAMLQRVREQGVQIAIMNAGGLRASIDEGEVTMGEILTVLPFQNTLSTFRVSGADVMAALENGVSQVEEVQGRFPQVSGLQFSWDPSGAAGEDRIVDVQVQGDDGELAPLDPAASYLLVSNNFVRNGGDGYAMFAENSTDAYDFGPNLEVVVRDYLAEQSPYTPRVDGRIREVE